MSQIGVELPRVRFSSLSSHPRPFFNNNNSYSHFKLVLALYRNMF